MRSVFFTLAFLLLASSLTDQQNSAARQTPLVLTHVVVIDVTRGQAQPDRTVVILGEYIAEIGESLKIAVPKDSPVVDATGKFLIPNGAQESALVRLEFDDLSDEKRSSSLRLA